MMVCLFFGLLLPALIISLGFMLRKKNQKQKICRACGIRLFLDLSGNFWTDARIPRGVSFACRFGVTQLTNRGATTMRIVCNRLWWTTSRTRSIARNNNSFLLLLSLSLFSSASRALAFHPRSPVTTNTSLKMSSSSAVEELLKCPSMPLREHGEEKKRIDHPVIGFGTYKVGFIPASASSAVASAGSETKEEQPSAKDCVSEALKAGYRFLECAEFYGNEQQVGEAIKESGIARGDLFLCSKVWTTTIEKGPEAVRQQLEQTLSDLQTDYVDLYLIHWPVPNKHAEAYKALVELQKEGKIRGIGVSNYALEDYLELKDDGNIPDNYLPVVNQIEINPFLYRKKTIEALQNEGVVLQSYRSLRDGKAMDHPVIAGIARKNNKTPAQVLGRWCVQKGFVYVPKSVKPERMAENAQVFDFALPPEDMDVLDDLTTPETLEKFQGLYRKCVNRDTTKDGTLDGVKMDITID